MGGSFPIDAQRNVIGHTILSPTFAAARGLDPSDIQSTVGANLPMSGTSTLGRTIIFNTAVNYRIKGKVWPMLEQNSTVWSSGAMDGGKTDEFGDPAKSVLLEVLLVVRLPCLQIGEYPIPILGKRTEAPPPKQQFFKTLVERKSLPTRYSMTRPCRAWRCRVLG